MKITSITLALALIAIGSSAVRAESKAFKPRSLQLVSPAKISTKQCHLVDPKTTRQTLLMIASIIPTVGPLAQIVVPLLSDGTAKTPSNPSVSFRPAKIETETRVRYFPGDKWDFPQSDVNVFIAKATTEQVIKAVKLGYLQVGLEQVLVTTPGAAGVSYTLTQAPSFFGSFGDPTLAGSVATGGVGLLANILYQSLTGQLPPPRISLIEETGCPASGKQYRRAS